MGGRARQHRHHHHGRGVRRRRRHRGRLQDHHGVLRGQPRDGQADARPRPHLLLPLGLGGRHAGGGRRRGLSAGLPQRGAGGAAAGAHGRAPLPAELLPVPRGAERRHHRGRLGPAPGGTGVRGAHGGAPAAAALRRGGLRQLLHLRLPGCLVPARHEPLPVPGVRGPGSGPGHGPGRLQRGRGQAGRHHRGGRGQDGAGGPRAALGGRGTPCLRGRAPKLSINSSSVPAGCSACGLPLNFQDFLPLFCVFSTTNPTFPSPNVCDLSTLCPKKFQHLFRTKFLGLFSIPELPWGDGDPLSEGQSPKIVNKQLLCPCWGLCLWVTPEFPGFPPVVLCFQHNKSHISQSQCL